MPSADRVQWARIRVGAVTISAMLILGTLCFLLTGGTLLEPKSTVYLYMPDAVGLASGSPVRVDGIGVGKVQAVALSGLNQGDRVVKVAMTIERDRLYSIPDDSTAQASADTLIGDKFVDITSGRSSKHIAPGGEITYKSTPDMIKRLDVSEFEDRLRVVDALVTEIEQGKTPLGQFVQGTKMYNSARLRLTEFERGIRAASKTTGELGQFLYTDSLYRKIAEPLLKLDDSLARIQSGQGAMGQFLRDNAQYAQLRDSVSELRKSIQKLRGSEFFSSGRQYAGWNRGVQSMIQSVDDFAASPMLATTATYDNLNGAAKELESAMKDFRENPRKYLRLKLF